MIISQWYGAFQRFASAQTLIRPHLAHGMPVWINKFKDLIDLHDGIGRWLLQKAQKESN